MYITHAELAERPGPRELAAQAAPDGVRLDVALMDATLRGADRSAWDADEIAHADAALVRIDAAIESAGALIDGYLQQGGYTVPISPVPTLVSQWCRMITRYQIHQDLVAKDGDPVVRDYRDALRGLEHVAIGKLLLGASAPVSAGTTGSPQVRPGRTPIRDALRDY